MCTSHFTEFIPTRRADFLTGPPPILTGASKSYLNQTNPQSRDTGKVTLAARANNQRKNKEKKDKIGFFKNFQQEIRKCFKYFQVRFHDADLMLSLTDKLG